MRKGDIREITVDGTTAPMAFLGRGFFTTAWKDLEGSVTLISSDPLKEALALFADQSLPHVPKIERLECDRPDGSQAYRMPYYERLTAKHKEAWRIYRGLEKAWTSMACKPPHEPRLAIDKSEKILDDLIVAAEVPASVTGALRSMLDAASNYGSGIALEFAPRNLAVDSEGNLILLDVMFDAERIAEYQRKKANRRNPQ